MHIIWKLFALNQHRVYDGDDYQETGISSEPNARIEYGIILPSICK